MYAHLHGWDTHGWHLLSERVWTGVKWANLAALVALLLLGGDLWVGKRCSGLVNQALTGYHQQVIQPILKGEKK